MEDANYQFNNASLLPKQPREPFLNIPLTIIIVIVFCFCIYCVTQYFFSDELYIESLDFFSFTPVLFKAAPLAFSHTIMSYSFIHGSFEHTAINMVWLLVFGSPLVRHFGSLRFLVFWVLTAAISALTYFAFHQNSIASLVGASGAVSGMMGAIARYGFSPVHFCVNTQNGRFFGPLWSVKKTLCSKTVLVYVCVWLMINFIIGIFSSLFERDDISIAWEAHIGGLISGFLLVGFFDVSRGKIKITL
ncbi:rhomboid family intramembrane serine protease [Bartonella koehlerae]|uniref:Peptidase S54 rhomboid domain-containing protein n=1 Tax=Bartonella koehlerae C-29 TaxID=1134510 RepID=A0A067W718_9HYPH|nr:rhomboid family intramembrane serine protease [Bartonella koehlerae]KEC55539.1 hypothetical protein O9A_00819 [Bartonella koehlerae C-29]